MARLLHLPGPLLVFFAVAPPVLAACAYSAPAEELGQAALPLATYPNEQPAFDFFRAKGLRPEQSAAIVGNLDVESGIDPTSVQKGGPGRGIAQWSAGGRWDATPNDNVKAYASQQGKSPTTLQLQLDFIWFELTTFPSYGLAKLRAATTVSAATGAFATYYEGCGACSTATRVAQANSVLERFGGNAVDAGTSSGDAAAGACTLRETGETGVCISTAACASLGSHTSTPGVCSGANDIQCCTRVGASSSSPHDGGSPDATNGTSSDHDDGPAADGGCSLPGHARGRGEWVVGLLGAALLIATRRRADAKKPAHPPCEHVNKTRCPPASRRPPHAHVAARVVFSGAHGHSIPPPVRESIHAELGWLTEGLPGWEGYASAPKLARALKMRPG